MAVQQGRIPDRVEALYNHLANRGIPQTGERAEGVSKRWEDVGVARASMMGIGDVMDVAEEELMSKG